MLTLIFNFSILVQINFGNPSSCKVDQLTEELKENLDNQKEQLEGGQWLPN
jgi:hypothetical protein